MRAPVGKSYVKLCNTCNVSNVHLDNVETPVIMTKTMTCLLTGTCVLII